MPPDDAETHIIRGTAFHAPVRGRVEVLHDHLFCVDGAGALVGIVEPADPQHQVLEDRARATGRLTRLAATQYLLPGFVDLHVHAPQWPQAGRALDRPVMEWLDDHTIPLEARFADPDFADRIYRDVVRTLLANGTTTAAYFATIHKQSTLQLARICVELGQRALVGKVVMDNHFCPDFYKDASAAQAVADTRWMLEAISALPGNGATVLPVITPRFIPNCSDEVLAALGSLAQDSGAHVQTHCDESDWVHQHVRARMGQSDTRALADFGLLTRRTILAHANFLDAEDMAVLRHHGAGIAHCPISNVFFADSVLPLAAHLRGGSHVGLGTDVAGGYSPSMFDALRQSILSARMLEDGVDPALRREDRGRANSRIDFRDAFWLATTGGAEVLDLPIGWFGVGRQWDAQIIDVAAPDSNIPQFDLPGDGLDVLQMILCNAQRSNVHTVWVAGRVVHQRAH